MVCKINIFILSTLLLFLTSSAFSENIRVGPISLSLGLEKSVALKLLNDHFYVMPVEGREIYLLSESGPPNIDIVGSVVFEKNHLTSIQRGWGAYEADSSPIDFSKSLYNALVNASEESGSYVKITNKITRIPGAEFKTLSFNFPDRRIFILITDGDSKFGKKVSIDEEIP